MRSIKLPDWSHSVHHDGSEKYVSNQYPNLGETVKIRLRVGLKNPINEVYVRTFPNGEQAFTPMTVQTSETTCRWWETEILVSQPDVNYRFLLIGEEDLWWYSAAG